MEDLRKHLRDIDADFDPVHLAHTVRTLVTLIYELASEGIPLNDTNEWRAQLDKICAVSYAAEILALVSSRWLDRHMVNCTPD